jgi:hypothetical protein
MRNDPEVREPKVGDNETVGKQRSDAIFGGLIEYEQFGCA